MSKNCIYLDTDKKSFLEELVKTVFDARVISPSLDFKEISQFQEEKTAPSNDIFIGLVKDDSFKVSLIAPKKIGMFSPLPYLAYLIMQRSPGTDILGRTDFELPPWFFKSTCTDIALSTYARNIYFEAKVKERPGGETELWYERKEVKRDFWRAVMMTLYYSLFPVIILAFLTDILLIPILLTMSHFEIKILYILVISYFLGAPFIANKAIAKFLDHNDFYLALLAMGIISVSVLIVTAIPNEFLVPSVSWAIGSICFFYAVFLALNFYTLNMMHEVIEAIFVKAMRVAGKTSESSF